MRCLWWVALLGSGLAALAVAACDTVSETGSQAASGGDTGTGGDAQGGVSAAGAGGVSAAGAGGVVSGGAGEEAGFAGVAGALGGAGGPPPVAGTAGVAGEAGFPDALGGAGGLPPVAGTAGVAGEAGAPGTGGIVTGGTGGEAGTGGTGTWYGTISTTAEAQVQAVYDSWRSTYYRDCGNGEACIEWYGSCYNMGIGTGMMAAVNQGDRATFDALWLFYENRRNSNGVMNWQYEPCTTNVWGDNGSSGPDLDTAMALVLADQLWGGYSADATTLITAIWDHDVADCGGRYELKPGDVWGGCADEYDQRVNPSYFSPGYYRAFAAYVPAQADRWNALLEDTYTDLDIYQSQSGGLMCDWARNQSCEGGFGYEAARCWSWRIATDFVWSGDSSAQQMLQTLSNYIDGQGGITALHYDRNSVFYGSLALSGVVRDQATFESYVNGWLNMATNDGAYEMMTFKLLFLQLASGQMRTPF